MKKYIIKTVDGNRYETTTTPLSEILCGFKWLSFPVYEGVGFVNINVRNIVCIVTKEVEE